MASDDWKFGSMIAMYGCPPPPRDDEQFERFKLPKPIDWLPTAFLPTALGHYLLHRHGHVIHAVLTTNGWFSAGSRIDPKEYNEWKELQLP